MMKNTTETPAMDIKQAELQVATYLELQNQKAAIETSMRGYKEKLRKFLDANPHLVDDNGNLRLEGGYLHLGKRTLIKKTKKFSLLEFVIRFPALLKWELKTAPLKALFKDDDTRKQFNAIGVDITEVPRFEIIAARPVIPFDSECLDVDKDFNIEIDDYQ